MPGANYGQRQGGAHACAGCDGDFNGRGDVGIPGLVLQKQAGGPAFGVAAVGAQEEVMLLDGDAPLLRPLMSAEGGGATAGVTVP